MTKRKENSERSEYLTNGNRNEKVEEKAVKKQ